LWSRGYFVLKISDKQLGKYLGFTVKDLAANRMGKLSARQNRGFSRRPYFIGSLLVGVIGVAGFLIYIIYTTEPPESEGTWGILAMIVGFGLFACVILFSNLRDSIKDTQHGGVHNITGPIEVKREWSDPGYDYYLFVSGKHFTVNRRAYEYLNKRSHFIFCAYYLSHSEILLSLEWVDN
jgi:hypothetical protein